MSGADGGNDQDTQRFLNPDRVRRIALLVTPLLRADLSWVERRKESIVLLDETALRRQVSVDFSLRSAMQPLLPAEATVPSSADDKPHEASEAASSDPLWCAPIFVVEKTAGKWMAFDLEDESGRSLHLMPRADNARVSGAVLVEMARTSLAEGEFDCELPVPLTNDLVALAEAEVAAAAELATRLKQGSCPRYPKEIALLRSDNRFMWWLSTLAHSSLLVALYRGAGPGRKMIKLRFEQPITEQPKLKNQLGWQPYRVGIENPLIEARSYHLEAEAPPGMRVTRALLLDDGASQPQTAEGFLKRVHLYRAEAQEAGAGSSALFLMVRGGGFIGGATIASALTLGVLLACIVWARNIAANPTSAPALLLVLPGLISTYVARPDRHALTTKLLFAARMILLSSAGCAYIAATKLALSGRTPETAVAIAARGEDIRTWMCWLAIPALLAFVSLAYALYRARVRFRQRSDTPNSFHASAFVKATPQGAYHHLRARNLPGFPRESWVEDDADEAVGWVRYFCGGWRGPWFFTFTFEDADRDAYLRVQADYLPRWPATLWARLAVASQADALEKRLGELDAWEPPPAEHPTGRVETQGSQRSSRSDEPPPSAEQAKPPAS